MSVFQHHPDGYIIIKVGESIYQDTIDNFNLDATAIGEQPYVIPSGKVDRIYFQSNPKQHTVADSHGNQEHLPHPWDIGEKYFSRFSDLVNAKSARVTPTQEEQARLNRESMRASINGQAHKDIVTGFTSSALGSPHAYNYSVEEQLNILEAVVIGGDTELCCVTQGGQEVVVTHTEAQVRQVALDGATHKRNILNVARTAKEAL